ncbi:MAG: porin, partial [Roseibacillus sp.]|nr:porin [Roseibacillus sp.]
AGKDDQWGYYIEPSYGFDFGNGKMGVFARYHEWDTGGGAIDSVSVGVNYWPVDNVVFKGDYTDEEGNDSFNLGVGYSF